MWRERAFSLVPLYVSCSLIELLQCTPRVFAELFLTI